MNPHSILVLQSRTSLIRTGHFISLVALDQGSLRIQMDAVPSVYSRGPVLKVVFAVVKPTFSMEAFILEHETAASGPWGYTVPPDTLGYLSNMNLNPSP